MKPVECFSVPPAHRERLHHVTSGVNELLVQTLHQVRIFDDNFRYETSGLEVASPLEF